MHLSFNMWQDRYAPERRPGQGAGARPWVWVDYIWSQREEFLREMPKDVLQGNWYYGLEFGGDNAHADAYRVLGAGGYDQVPAGSNYNHEENFTMTVAHCRGTVAPSRLLGFLQTPWLPTVEAHRLQHRAAIACVKEAGGGGVPRKHEEERHGKGTARPRAPG